jgi:hypothetical protein
MKKNSKQDSLIVKEYLRRLSDDELDLIVERLTQPVSGDRADVSYLFAKDKEIDKWLMQAKSAFDWFDKVDLIQDQSEIEKNKRQKSKEKK